MQQNIYFRKDVWEKFGKEEKKSELVNHLLELHYEDDVVVPGSFKADEESVSYTVAPKVIKTAKDVPKPREITQDLKFCKNGHPLMNNGKCTGKSCKYA